MSDIEDIRAFTVEHWSREQWLRYFAGLAGAFERIADDPDCGRPRDWIRQGMRSLGYERHLIFFELARVPGGRMTILRVIHERRNLAALSYLDDLES